MHRDQSRACCGLLDGEVARSALDRQSNCACIYECVSTWVEHCAFNLFFFFFFLGGGGGCLPYFLEQVKSSILHCEYAFVTMLVYFGALISMTYMAVVFFSLPGRYEAFWKEFDGVKQVWKNRKELKVEDLGIVTLFGVELYAWFCVGEIVGRGFTITGYKV